MDSKKKKVTTKPLDNHGDIEHSVSSNKIMVDESIYMTLLPILIPIILGAHHLLVGPKIAKMKKGGTRPLQNQITKLVSTCTTKTTKWSKPSAPSLLYEAIILLDQITKVFEDLSSLFLLYKATLRC